MAVLVRVVQINTRVVKSNRDGVLAIFFEIDHWRISSYIFCVNLSTFQALSSILSFLRTFQVPLKLIFQFKHFSRVLSPCTNPVFKIKFIDSLNFIPMRLADFTETFALKELAKGYFHIILTRRKINIIWDRFQTNPIINNEEMNRYFNEF